MISLTNNQQRHSSQEGKKKKSHHSSKAGRKVFNDMATQSPITKSLYKDKTQTLLDAVEFLGSHRLPASTRP